MVRIDKKVRKITRKYRSGMVKGTRQKPRVVLSESNRYLRVQAIDDTVGHTILSASTEEEIFTNNNYSRKNKDCAKKLGENFANKLKGEKFESIIFDRNGRLYHGKIKEFCEIMRKSGINF